MCRAWGLKVWEDGARLLLPVWGRAGPGLCAARVTELRSQATCARTSASRGSAGEAGLSRWISLRPVKLAVKWSCGGTSPRVAHRLAVHRATPAVGISLLKWQLARRAGCCREAAGRVRAGLPAVGAPGCRLLGCPDCPDPRGWLLDSLGPVVMLLWHQNPEFCDYVFQAKDVVSVMETGQAPFEPLDGRVFIF